jgi:hypothetical protein
MSEKRTTMPNTRLSFLQSTTALAAGLAGSASLSCPLFGEGRLFTFRAEMYDIFNQTQFSGINTTIQHDLSNWQRGVLQQTNNQLGRYTSARDPRRMAMSLRFQF